MTKEDKIQAIANILLSFTAINKPSTTNREKKDLIKYAYKRATAIEEAIGVDEDEIKTSLKHNYHRFNIGGNPPYSMIAKAISTNKEVIRIGSGQNE